MSVFKYFKDNKYHAVDIEDIDREDQSLGSELTSAVEDYNTERMSRMVIGKMPEIRQEDMRDIPDSRR